MNQDRSSRQVTVQLENGRPPKTKELRKQQIELMQEEDREILYELDEEFTNCEDDFQVLLAEYIAAHRQEFLRA